MFFTFDRRINLKRYKIAYFSNKGFTLIELMITVGIFVFMTALVMSRYNDFYSGIIFKNMAYDIVVTIRQAQSYGISVKVDADNSFNKAYGVNFSSGNPGQFSLYSYSNSGSNYSLDDLEKTYSLKFGATISERRVGSAAAVTSGMNVLDIIFQRPNPEAIICGTPAGGGSVVMTCNYNYARIILKLGEKTKEIQVNRAGQISIID